MALVPSWSCQISWWSSPWMKGSWVAMRRKEGREAKIVRGCPGQGPETSD